MWNSKQLLSRQNDPWAPQNIDKSTIQYPSLQSSIPYRNSDPPNIQNYSQQNNNNFFIPPENFVPILNQIPVIPKKQIKNNQIPIKDEKKNNNYNIPIPWDDYQGHEKPQFNNYPTDNGNNNYNNRNQERQKPKIFDNANRNNSPSNNNGWGEDQNNRKPINLFQKLVQKQQQPVNLWSSKFASVLKRNIQLSVFQIKKKVDYEGREDGNNWLQDQKKRHQSKFFNAGMGKLEDFLNEQVVLIEASPHQLKLKQLKKRGQVFRDQDFPPTQQSLTGEWGHVKAWKDITWKRISSLIPNPVIFDKKIVPESIKQGILGDCYLLAGLAALAESPQRIFNLFLTTDQNPQKYYAVKILYKGMWKTIDIDQYIPVQNNKPAFSKAQGPELWVVLLEKAWAKLYGSYKNIQAGYPEQGLHDFTGAHVEMLRMQKKGFDPEYAWRYLMSASRKKFSMIASSQPGSDTNQLFSGVVLGHAYTVMAVYEIQVNGKLQRLIKLRNPWGRTQTKGPWSDKDPIWKNIPRQQRQRLGYVDNQHDGICFQSYRDFLRDFRTVTVAEVSDTASYVYHTQQTHPYKGCYFRVKIFKQGQYSFQINQTPDRMFPKDVQKNFKYLPSTMLIGRVDGNKVRHYQGCQQPYRTIYKRHNLVPGDYVVFGKIYYNKHQTDYSVTLSVYGQNVCLVQPCPTNFCPNFKERLYMDRAKHSKCKQLKSGIFYNQEILTEGYIYCAMWNRSNRAAKFMINVEPNHNPAVRLKKPFKGQKQIKMVIEPNKQHIILARVPDFTNPTGGIGSVQFVG